MTDNLSNTNGDSISVVPTRIRGSVADVFAEDVNFNVDCYILASADGTIVVEDSRGGTASVVVFEGQFFPAMVRGVVASGSDAIAISYWT